MAKWRSAVAAGAALVVLAACAGDDDGTDNSDSRSTATATTESGAPPYETATFQQELVDTSRPTVRADGAELAPSRTLTTTVWHPEDTAGPVPLIVLAHGYTGHPDLYDEQLGPAWAAAGYVVVAPAFPLTNREAPGGAELGDYRSQPADVSFVLDEVLALAGDPASPLDGLVDAEHIGLVGHSLGGVTAFAVGFNSCCHDERFDAVVIFAAVPGSFEGTYGDTGTPLLMMLGHADDAVAYPAGVAAYEQAAPPKYLVTILGGTHSPPFEDAPDPADIAVEELTVDFWNGYLRDDAGALDALREDGDRPGVTTIEYESI